MSNTFRRPMFRRGGEAMTGIMNNVTPRGHFAESNYSTDFTEQLREAAGNNYGVDPLTSWLLRAGPAMMNEPKRGGTLGTLARATAPATEQALSDLGARAKSERDIRLAGAQLGIKKQTDEDLLQMKIDAGAFGDRQSSALKEIALKKFIDRDMPTGIADHAADWTVEKEAELINKAQGRYGGVLEFDMKRVGKKFPETMKADLKVLKGLNGKIVYDPFSQTYKMLEWKDGRPGVKFEWNTIEEISIPVAPEPVKEVGKYDSEIADKIFDVGIGQQMLTP